MTFRYGRGWVHDEATGDNDGAGGNGAAAGDGSDAGGLEGGDGDQGGEVGRDGDTAAGDTKEGAPKDMKSAIDDALGYKGGVDGKGEPGAKKPDAGKETETHHANGKPKKDEKGQDVDPDGKVAQKGAPKVKSSAELDLKADQLKFLKPETQQRFREVITALKTHEGTIQKQAEQVKVLAAGRDAILGVMQETNTTQDQLSGYLYFNQLLQSNKPEDLESALDMVERQRAGLYKALGREPEGGGLDLLADFPDLKQQVEDEEITRAAALEISRGRREKSARDQSANRNAQQQRTETERKAKTQKDGEAALSGIEAWTAELRKSDLDYTAKEDKLLAKLDEVLSNYSPDKWLPTLKLLYAGIEITKSQAAGGGNKPLRPSGARPGAKAPDSMLDAINQGLGYAGAEKG